MDKTWIFGFMWTICTVYLAKLVSGLCNLLLCYLLLPFCLNGKGMCLNFERRGKQRHCFRKVKTILNPSATFPLPFPSKRWLTSALTWGWQPAPVQPFFLSCILSGGPTLLDCTRRVIYCKLFNSLSANVTKAIFLWRPGTGAREPFFMSLSLRGFLMRASGETDCDICRAY